MFGLYEAAHRTAELFGFRYVETPMFEHTELFTRTSGETSDVVTKEMYTFEDKGGRSLTLRPESSASVMRAYLTHAQELPNPFKAYYVGSEFRHGRPQAGRLREFRQFGIEVIGVEGAAADVEVVVLGERYLRECGLRRYDLHLNTIGDANCRPAYREMLVDYFEPYRDRLDEDCRTRLSKNPLRVFDCKVDGGKDFVLAAPTMADICARRVPRTSRRFAQVWTKRACVRDRSATGARSGLLHAVGVRVGLERADARIRRPRSTRAADTTDSRRRSADSRRPVWGSRWGWIACSWRSKRRERRCRRLVRPDVFVVAIGSDAEAAGRRMIAGVARSGHPGGGEL